MASITGYGSKHSHEFTLNINEISYDVANNTSTVSFDFTIYKSSYSWNGWNSISYSVNIDGVNYTGTIPNYTAGNRMTIRSGTQTITHNSDGTKSIGFNFSVIDSSGQSYTCGNASANGTMALSNIPRASTITCSTANIEETATIIINKTDNAFTYTLNWYFGNLSGKIVEKTANTIIGWTLPSSFYSQIPNNKSGVGAIECITYNGNTQVGSCIINFYATTSETRCKPDLTAIIEDINEDTIALTGDSNNLIKYKSTAKITITTSSKNSATIVSKKVNNTIVSGNILEINNVEDSLFTVTVTDSRGYTNTVILEPEVVEYVNLSINATIKRTGPTTDEVDIEYSGNYYNGSFGVESNTLSLKWYYKEKNTQNWILGGTLTPTISSNTYNNGSSKVVLGSNFNYKKSYEFYLEVKDKITTLFPSYSITQGIPVYNWGENFFNVNEDLQHKGRSLIKHFEYSTDEEVVGTWIDGKPIYRKVIDHGLIGNRESISINGNYDELISFGGCIYSQNGTTASLSHYYNSGSWRYVEGAIVSGEYYLVRINRVNTSAWSDWGIRTIIEYTKTSD